MWIGVLGKIVQDRCHQPRWWKKVWKTAAISLPDTLDMEHKSRSSPTRSFPQSHQVSSFKTRKILRKHLNRSEVHVWKQDDSRFVGQSHCQQTRPQRNQPSFLIRKSSSTWWITPSRTANRWRSWTTGVLYRKPAIPSWWRRLPMLQMSYAFPLQHQFLKFRPRKDPCRPENPCWKIIQVTDYHADNQWLISKSYMWVDSTQRHWLLCW